MERLAGPRAVAAALDAGRAIDRILVARGAKGSQLQAIIDRCRKQKLPLRFEPREQLDRLSQGATHQGILAMVAQRSYASLEELIAASPDDALMVVADGVSDPRNLGAIVRSACAAGAVCVVVPERRSAGLTETVSKAAAGGLEYTPVARVKNINRSLDLLKKNDFWVFGLDERGEQAHFDVDLSGRTALVFGSEGEGLHKLTASKCDALLKIPTAGQISSLNVSVAAGVVLFEALRQKRQARVSSKRG